MRLFAKASYRFIERWKVSYAVSVLALSIGVAAMVVNIVTTGSWLNYGVDFTGGSLIQVRFEGDVTDAELRAALGGAESPPITRFGAVNEFVIRTPLPEDGSIEGVADRVEAQIREALPAEPFTVVRTEAVGAKVGGELQQKAALAIFFSFIVTLIYLAIRFEPTFGVAALIAILHDMLATLGFLAVFRTEISLTTIAALLTILGYSLNDTIVIFDRIREKFRAKGARKRDPVVMVNEAINETLPRTIMTAGTTLAVLLSLFVLGGAVIRDFALILILGAVIAGTYSSIFIASPALLQIRRRWGAGKTEEKPKQRPQPATV